MQMVGTFTGDFLKLTFNIDGIRFLAWLFPSMHQVYRKVFALKQNLQVLTYCSFQSGRKYLDIPSFHLMQKARINVQESAFLSAQENMQGPRRLMVGLLLTSAETEGSNKDTWLIVLSSNKIYTNMCLKSFLKGLELFCHC